MTQHIQPVQLSFPSWKGTPSRVLFQPFRWDEDINDEGRGVLHIAVRARAKLSASMPATYAPSYDLKTRICGRGWLALNPAA